MKSIKGLNALFEYLQFRDINFLAICTSNYQTLGVDVVIDLFETRNININGVVLLVTDNRLTLFSSHYKKENIEYIIYEPELDKNIWKYRFSFIKYILKKRVHNFYLVYFTFSYEWYDFVHKFNNDYKINWIMIEDGIGNYRDFEYIVDTPLHGVEFCSVRFLALYTIGKIKRIGYKFLYKMVQPREIFLVNKNENNKKNEKIISLYKKEIGKRKEYIECSKISTSIEGKVVILTEFVSEDSVTREIEYLLVKQICEFFKRHGTKYIIKPHPRQKNIDVYKKLGDVFLESTKVSMELLVGCAQIPPLAIIGVESSVLYTTSVLYGIKCFSLGEIIIRNPKFYNVGVKREIKEYESVFSDCVCYIQSIDDLIQLCK